MNQEGSQSKNKRRKMTKRYARTMPDKRNKGAYHAKQTNKERRMHQIFHSQSNIAAESASKGSV